MGTTEGIGGFLSVSDAEPATYDDTGFAALIWTDNDQAETIPDYGAEHATVTFTPLKTGIVDKFHGELNYGSLDIGFAVDTDDPGQAILKAARLSKDTISCRETFSDGTVRYFAAKVMSFKDGGASVGSVKMGMAKVEIVNEVVDGV